MQFIVIRKTKFNSKIITKERQLTELVDMLKSSKAFTFDWETDESLDVVCNPKAIGLGLYTDALSEAKFIPVGFNSIPEQLPIQKVIKAVQPLFNDDADRLAIAHNAKFDTAINEFYGMKITRWNSRIRCSQVLAHLADENKFSGLKERVLIEFGHKMRTLKDIQGKRGTKSFKRLIDQPIEVVADYCGEDVYWTWQLWFKTWPIICKDKFLENYYLKIEHPFIRTLKAMHKRGMSIDWDLLKEIDIDLEAMIEVVESRIHKMAGYPINLNSPLQKAKLLYGELKLDKKLGIGTLKKSKKTGNSSTDKTMMDKLTGLHPIVAPIQRFTSLSKLKATYTSGMPKHKLADGKIHTSFNQASVDTGRLSSSDPNLQNIPAHSKLGKKIRRCFIPPDGKTLIVGDYDNIELKILAHQSQDKVMLEKFRNGEDLHSLTASSIFNLPLNQCDKTTPEGAERRDKGKKINFGIMYGMQRWALARQLGILEDEAEEYRQTYFGLYPGVRDYVTKIEKQAHNLGFVRTLFGRKRRLPNAVIEDDGDWENKRDIARAYRQATNHTIQGSQSEIIKMAMNRIEDEVPEVALHLQVHDELVGSCDPELADKVIEEMRDRMMFPTLDHRNILCIPMTVTFHKVESWGLAK